MGGFETKIKHHLWIWLGGKSWMLLPSVRALSYQEIPGMSDTTVEGHAGKLILSEFENFQILVFQGRRHYYEGAGWGPIRLPVFLSHHLGTGDLLLTNAAGNLKRISSWRPYGFR